MRHKPLSPPQKWILVGIPILFIIGSIMHFAYNIFGESPIVGLFAPVNESIWEHSKMLLWPVILWWSIYYCARGKLYEIDKNKWFSATLVSLLTSLAVMPLSYYFYTQAFGVEYLWVDIFILLLSILLGQLLGLHVYQYGNGLNAKLLFILLFIIAFLFMLFTFFPPHIPLFQDGVTGNFGISLFMP